jgi:hypothetical protein
MKNMKCFRFVPLLGRTLCRSCRSNESSFEQVQLDRCDIETNVPALRGAHDRWTILDHMRITPEAWRGGDGSVLTRKNMPQMTRRRRCSWKTQSIAMCKFLRLQTPVSKHEFARPTYPLICREAASKLHHVKAF